MSGHARHGAAPAATRRNGLPVRPYEYHGADGAEDENAGTTPARARTAGTSIATPDAGLLPVVDVRIALCRLCAADLCDLGCFEGPCKCACRDERKDA
jgi:hypothetical protein